MDKFTKYITPKNIAAFTAFVVAVGVALATFIEAV